MTFRSIRLCLITSCLLLGAGLAGPSMRVAPGFGPLSPLVSLFRPELTTPAEYSLLQGIWQLVSDSSVGQIAIGVLLFVFSVLFPIGKLSLMWVSLQLVAARQSPARSLGFIERHGKLSMLDIYVVALLVLAIKGLPGGTEVSIGWGIFAFSAAILLSLKIPHWITEHAPAAETSVLRSPDQGSCSKAERPSGERDIGGGD